MKQTKLATSVTTLDSRLRADVLLVPVVVRKDKIALPKVRGLSRQVAGRLAELVRHYHGAKRAGAVDDCILPAGAPFGRIAVVSLGEDEPAKSSDVRDAAGLAIRWCAKHRAAKVAVAADVLRAAAGDEAIAAWVEGTVLGSYRFVELQSKPPENGGTRVAKMSLATASARTDKMTRMAGRAAKLAEAVNLSRDLGHLPPNVINPVTLAGRVRAIAKKHKLRCRVLDERQMKARKMGAIVAVGSGSASKPRMIVVEYNGRRPKSRPIVLVGKAITLDSGGYSLKPAASIPDMKYDKCGAMAVIGAIVAAARLKIPQRVVGILGAAENMISGEAYRPGDIVRAANGKTIEIMNTDAEGRVVLADCLHYAEKTYAPKAIIDLATLTGACKVALGTACAAVLSENDKMAAELIASGERTHERLWRMPLWKEYLEPLTTNTDADIKNTAGAPGGCSVAAMFLKEFVGDKTPWAHLDIAGMADTAKEQPICPIGATGFGVRLLLDYIQRQR